MGTGGYGDGNCADEHLWAAAELWRTTGESDYEKLLPGALWRLQERRTGRQRRQPPAEPALIRATNPQGWGNVTNLGLWTYVLGKGKDAAAAGAIRDDSLKAADEIVRALRNHRATTTA